MTIDASTQTKSELCCSFCGKHSDQIDKLIAGPIFGTVRIYMGYKAA